MVSQVAIAGKFGRDNIWRIDSYKLFGRKSLANGRQSKEIIIAWSVALFYALR